MDLEPGWLRVASEGGGAREKEEKKGKGSEAGSPGVTCQSLTLDFQKENGSILPG